MPMNHDISTFKFPVIKKDVYMMCIEIGKRRMFWQAMFMILNEL